MKKLALVLVMLLIFTTACAEGLDFASMDDATLHSIVDGARNELAKRELNTGENTVLFEQEGVSVYLTGEYETKEYDTVYLSLKAVVVNDSDKTVWISTDSLSVNGWDVYSYGLPDTTAGKKQKCELEFCISDAEISSYDEVEEIEVVFSLVDSDTYETFSTTEPIIIHF